MICSLTPLIAFLTTTFLTAPGVPLPVAVSVTNPNPIPCTVRLNSAVGEGSATFILARSTMVLAAGEVATVKGEIQSPAETHGYLLASAWILPYQGYASVSYAAAPEYTVGGADDRCYIPDSIRDELCAALGCPIESYP